MDKQPAGTLCSRADPKSDFELRVVCEAGRKLRSWGGGKEKDGGAWAGERRTAEN